jgi:4-hydroxyacetophenone monooxygenase
VSGDKPSLAFIRRAVEGADLNAVRVALYHNTGDAALAELPTAAKLDDAQRALLIDKAVAWLAENAGPGDLPEPPLPELRRLMNMVTGGEMGDLEFEARHQITGFRPYPFMAGWTGEKPAIPAGFKVAVIGSGFAGITTGVQLDLLGIPYEIYERRAEPGGVWSINRYPDVRVDTASITYEYLFERGHAWSEYFGRGPEVRAYLAEVSRKHGVWDKTRFNHDLKRATFDEARDLWVIELDTPDGRKVVEANVIISCSGLFATPHIPRFEGQDDFKGQIVHTALWPDGLDLKGKRVATLGNGSTGVQMLGAIAREAAQVYCFQRTPQWVSPRDKYGQPMEPETVWLARNFPGYWNWWRYSATSNLFETHQIMLIDREWQAKGGLINPVNDAIRADLVEYIKRETGGRQDLIDKVTPDYAPMSRRPVVDNGWYRALTRDNVELVTDGIERLTAEGVQTTDGRVREVDVIVTATGFEVAKYLWPARYVGRDGADLHDTWDAADGARAYIGMMVPRFPNFYMLYGPNSQPLSGGPAQPVWFAIWAAYAAQGLVRMLEEGKSRIEVKPEAYERYNSELDEESKKLIQMTKEGGVDKNYYVNNEYGRLQVNAPWYSPFYHRLCSRVEWDDLELSNNRVAALSGEGKENVES